MKIPITLISIVLIAISAAIWAMNGLGYHLNWLELLYTGMGNVAAFMAGSLAKEKFDILQ